MEKTSRKFLIIALLFLNFCGVIIEANAATHPRFFEDEYPRYPYHNNIPYENNYYFYPNYQQPSNPRIADYYQVNKSPIPAAHKVYLGISSGLIVWARASPTTDPLLYMGVPLDPFKSYTRGLLLGIPFGDGLSLEFESIDGKSSVWLPNISNSQLYKLIRRNFGLNYYDKILPNVVNRYIFDRPFINVGADMEIKGGLISLVWKINTRDKPTPFISLGVGTVHKILKVRWESKELLEQTVSLIVNSKVGTEYNFTDNFSIRAECELGCVTIQKSRLTEDSNLQNIPVDDKFKVPFVHYVAPRVTLLLKL